MPVNSSVTPPKAEGACIVSILEEIYIYGGLLENRSSNSMWRYNLGTGEYT